MKIRKTFLMLSLTSSLFACISDDVLTNEDIKTQNISSKVVANILFDNDIDETASYNIRKDGYVVIQFDSSVSEKTYTKVVNQLRSNSSVPGVWAEQSGLEVCSLR